ncbi:molybdopterin-dependent oxidoreductase [Syntrophobacter fumaroxidans]|uniref:Molybdopterin oxidoreductase n=1 Tax=Syntrophobacter fumaroxidans (strain DSM 10017 / MPOB) TaxID=335543 RepID=A0LN66_SYNFM|nr:molybdopterin-dependent oxidoreductase [Syntrophobacter fumaroxidans]ABK18868.1 molybdopterin oxidoreductase [Syntrophobacter fumaroxidans MPOB]
MKTVTACTLDCPDSCSLVVETSPNGKTTLRGNPDHPVTAGFVCRKARNFVKRLRSPYRITSPLLRRGGEWLRLGWDEALDLCARKIGEYRREPQSILHVHGEGAKGVLKQASKLFFALLGSSRVKGSLCDSAGYVAYVADFGSRDNNSVTDLLNARAIVNWGRDLSRSSVHTAAVVERARRGGTRVLTVSPGGMSNASASDITVRIRPGTDRFLAAAVIRRLIERERIGEELLTHTKGWEDFRELVLARDPAGLAAACEVNDEDIERIYSFYADGGPVATIVGTGLQRYLHGGENVRFINALAVLSGNMGRSGGGSHYHLHSLHSVDFGWAKGPAESSRRTLVYPTIGRNILEASAPPVRMLWVNGSNFVNQAPDSLQTVRALEKIKFKVVVDAFMTDTARHADLVLPCALILEQEDIVASYLHDFVHHVKKVFDPPGEARTDYEILSELGRRLDPPILLPDPQTCFRAALDRPNIEGTLEELRAKCFIEAKRPAVAYPGMVFAHSDGKCRFPPELHPEPPPPEGYPLRLLTLIRGDSIHSQIPQEDQAARPTVWIAPENPFAESGERLENAWVVSPLGRLRVEVRLMAGLHPAVVLYRRGDWMSAGGGANRLIAAGLTDMGSGAPFYEQYVRLETE